MAGTQVEPGVREQQASLALVLQAAWRRAGRTDFALVQHLTWAKVKHAGMYSVTICWLAILGARLAL